MLSFVIIAIFDVVDSENLILVPFFKYYITPLHVFQLFDNSSLPRLNVLTFLSFFIVDSSNFIFSALIFSIFRIKDCFNVN